mmetsp:Transcript_36677/g.77934  ORF Transcript_36677/g.77934 Transcript_36677/m.77934 type:complete len:89 (-) Transcript_36677:105-371(-)
MFSPVRHGNTRVMGGMYVGMRIWPPGLLAKNLKVKKLKTGVAATEVTATTTRIVKGESRKNTVKATRATATTITKAVIYAFRVWEGWA